MATELKTPPASVSSSSENDGPGNNNVTLEMKLTILQDKFANLEEKFNSLLEKEITNGEGAVSDKDTDTSVNADTTDGKKTQNTPEVKETGPVSRASILINKYDPASGERKDEQPSETTPDVTKVQATSHAFILRKFVGTGGEENSGELEIVDRDLWKLLKELLGHYPYHTFQGDPVTVISPYEPFIFNWNKLERAAKESRIDGKDEQARMDLGLLLDTLSNGSGDPKLDKYLKARDSSKEQKIVTFESLWTLFPPGSLVYGKMFLGQDQVFIVQDNSRPWPRNTSEPSPWTLECWTYDWDGKTFKRRALVLEIESFESSKPITSLPFYPVDYHPDPEELKRRLVDRGGKYKRLCTAKQGSRMFDYEGKAILAKRGFSDVSGDNDEGMTTSSYDYDLGNWEKAPQTASLGANKAASKTTYVDGRVMVDFESYFNFGPKSATLGDRIVYPDSRECQCLDCQGNTVWDSVYRNRFDKDAHQAEWEEEQFMLCPPRVLAYILSDKQWAQLMVTGLRDIPKKGDDRSWDRVKLADGDKTKDMILNLVKGHGTSNSTDDDGGLVVDDIVEKKGKGLVILLYGLPGVGKTSTAETVAIAARKPLFPISVADVGTEAKKVEANLSRLFALATSWQAILLIDEADVFLESRGKGASSSTERNALVSVFLRFLDYYQGILMLTTNQIAHFDVAVQSRIHVAIKYSKLSPQQTMDIFMGFLNPLIKRDRVHDIDEIKEWIEDDVYEVGLDGRQIRNILTSALGLARAGRKTKLEKKDLKMILDNLRAYKRDTVVQFEKYRNSQEPS